MSPERSVYLLDPRTLDPETIAVTFAKTSRSPESFHEIAAQLTTEKSAEFHEKWVVGYGHSSVAEHAVLHIAAENISRLAVETLESNRLASYTEKSTRYQQWDSNLFYTPPELEGHPLQELYTRTCQTLFNAYQQSLPAVKAVVQAENPRGAGESEAAWERRLRSQHIDVCRFFLPAASLANVGVTINARSLEHAIRKLLSSPLAEVQAMGHEIKAVAQANVPTLVKYADAVPYLQLTGHEFSSQAQVLPTGTTSESDWCRLIDYTPNGENQVLAAALYRYSAGDYAQLLSAVNQASPDQRKQWADLLFGSLARFDIPLRESEYLRYTFDLTLDQGAYFELKRHRMMTQTPQALTALLGYALPRRMALAGWETPFREVMDQARQAYLQLAAWNPAVASYVVPNAFNRRVLLDMNLRTAYHFIGLRSAANAHFSVRRAARRMAEQIRAVTPLLGSYLPDPCGETWQQVQEEHFIQV